MNTYRMMLVSSFLMVGGPAQAQVADSGAFIVRLGNDTIAVERYVRTASSLVAEAVLRTPQTRSYTMNLTFDSDGRVSAYEVQNNPVAGVPNSTPRIRSVITYGADTALVQSWYGAEARTRSVPAKPHMIPLQLPFYSTIETALLRVRTVDEVATRMSMLSANGPINYLVAFSRDSVKLAQPGGGVIRARVDKDGRLLELDGEGTTFKVRVTRAPWPDLDAYLKRYAAADAEGKSIGALSPRDTLTARIDGKTAVTVAYGRPSKRGRSIFGGIVKWGEVWRTGANAATSITFADTVVINGVTVPRGKYTLWTLPDAKQWLLIINTETGQWGTSYDATKDLARIPVKAESVPVPVETFTIGFRPSREQANLMTLTWDKTRLVVPISTR